MCQKLCWVCQKFSKCICWFSLSLSNGSTARGGPRPPSRVSSILPGLGQLFSNFYTLALLHLPPIHLPSAAWVSFWGAFLLAHWGGLSWINHRHPGVWHVLPISVYSACRISQCRWTENCWHFENYIWCHFRAFWKTNRKCLGTVPHTEWEGGRSCQHMPCLRETRNSIQR